MYLGNPKVFWNCLWLDFLNAFVIIMSADPVIFICLFRVRSRFIWLSQSIFDLVFLVWKCISRCLRTSYDHNKLQGIPTSNHYTIHDKQILNVLVCFLLHVTCQFGNYLFKGLWSIDEWRSIYISDYQPEFSGIKTIKALKTDTQLMLHKSKFKINLTDCSSWNKWPVTGSAVHIDFNQAHLKIAIDITILQHH